MAAHANLTEAQRERLEMIAEEASEIVQITMKILRHGVYSYHPSDPNTSNKRLLVDELIELWAIYERMVLCGDLPRINFFSSAGVWKEKLKWTHHQEDKDGES